MKSEELDIKYEELKVFKYRLRNEINITTDLIGYDIKDDFFTLSRDGDLSIKDGYRWDGPSGPMLDTENSMVGSCIHDAGYQMIRMELLPLSEKSTVDKMLKEAFTLSGMCKARVYMSYYAVKYFGWSSVIPGDVYEPKIKEINIV